MSQFDYRDGALFAEGVAVETLAETYGTPLYIYSRAELAARYQAFAGPLDTAAGHRVCFAVKANGNLAVLNVLARLGAGFDIVSGGELARVQAAGGDPARTVFSGVAKQAWEIERALEAGIGSFNVESAAELERIGRIAEARGLQAPVCLRVNPDVDPDTHPYIATGLRENKFGIDMESAAALYREAAAHPGLEIHGLACHIGSQLMRSEPAIEATARLCDLADRLVADGLPVRELDLGGGVGVGYGDETPPDPGDHVTALRRVVGDRPYRLTLEPGRAIAAPAGLLLTRVEYLKSGPARDFAIVDAGMNDLLRPALYDAWHAIVPARADAAGPRRRYDIVGPVCETGDFLGRDRALALAAGDLLAVRDAGAYGFTMSSNYNARPRPAEVMVDGARAHLVRARETLAALYAGESLLP